MNFDEFLLDNFLSPSHLSKHPHELSKYLVKELASFLSPKRAAHSKELLFNVNHFSF
jgi:hypothetical protein